MKTIAAALALSSMLAAVPADARDRRDHGRKHHREKKDDGVGAFIAGAVLAGGLVALLAKKPKTERVAIDVEQGEPVAYERVQMAPSEADPEAATAACVASVEHEGRRVAPIARVARVTATEPDGTGFRVTGDLLLRASWREEGERRGFRCTVDAQAVRAVDVDGLEVAAVLP